MLPKKILVTGANGQLGSELKDLAPQYSAVHFLFVGRDEFPLNDLSRIKAFLLSERPDVLINCAAYTAVDTAETDKENAFLVNAHAVKTMAEVCKEMSSRFIHISTDYVFDGAAHVPYSVDAKANPKSVYGASKQKGEELALAANADTIIVRTAWVYSAYGKNFVKTMLRLMDSKPEIGVVNDQFGSPTYAADLAAVLLAIALTDHPPKGIFHFTNEGVISWYEFAQAIKEIHGSGCKVNPIPTTAYPTPAARPSYSVLDTSRIYQEFPSLEPHHWKDSLKRCLAKLSDA